MEKNYEIITPLHHRKYVGNDKISHVDCHCKIGNEHVSVFYTDGTTKDFIMNMDGYNMQFRNIPISVERNWIFWGSWRNGLRAYDLLTGNLVWKINGGNYANILVYGQYLIAVRRNNRLLRLNIENGDILNESKSGLSMNAYALDDRYFCFVKERSNSLVYDATDFSIYKQYPHKNHLPSNFIVRDTWLEDNRLLTEGFVDDGISGVMQLDPSFYDKSEEKN
ncbi:MAG: hypothetical protein IJO74_03080 [Clostridia bacterium]|nr:hypothetical protein [Clostridia bacterium]